MGLDHRKDKLQREAEEGKTKSKGEGKKRLGRFPDARRNNKK